MALFDSGSPVANVALSDTFNTWRIRTNQINTQAAGLASNNTFTGTLNTFNNAVTVSGTLTADNAGFAGAVTAPVFAANTLTGTISTAAQPNITSVGTLTTLSTGQITGTSGAGFAGLVTAPRFTANTLSGTTISGTLSTAAQPNITSVGTLTALSTGQITGTSGAGFAGKVTAPLLEANNINNTSDITLKDNIEPAPGITILNVLNPVGFTWKDTDKKSYGLIAQELETIMPELVSDSENGKKAVSYIPLIALLIKGIQEQEKRIIQLENR